MEMVEYLNFTFKFATTGNTVFPYDIYFQKAIHHTLLLFFLSLSISLLHWTCELLHIFGNYKSTRNEID